MATTMKMHRGDRKSLEGLNKCSVWQRHTFMTPHVTMQPEWLQQIHDMHYVVAALQAAFDGVVPHTQGVAPGLHLLLSFRLHIWAMFTQGVASGLHLLQSFRLHIRAMFTQGIASGLHLLQSFRLHIRAMFTQGVATGLYLLQPEGWFIVAIKLKNS